MSLVLQWFVRIVWCLIMTFVLICYTCCGKAQLYSSKGLPLQPPGKQIISFSVDFWYSPVEKRWQQNFGHQNSLHAIAHIAGPLNLCQAPLPHIYGRAHRIQQGWGSLPQSPAPTPTSPSSSDPCLPSSFLLSPFTSPSLTMYPCFFCNNFLTFVQETVDSRPAGLYDTSARQWQVSAYNQLFVKIHQSKLLPSATGVVVEHRAFMVYCVSLASPYICFQCFFVFIMTRPHSEPFHTKIPKSSTASLSWIKVASSVKTWTSPQTSENDLKIDR